MRQPTWLYSANPDGTVVAGVFDASEAFPEGWVDHPDKAKKPTPKRGPGRPPKNKDRVNDDSA